MFHPNTKTFFAFLILLTTFNSYAADVKPTEKACALQKPQEDTYIDITHSYLSSLFCEPALWFDDFFTDEHILEEYHPGTLLRWRNDLVFTEGKSSADTISSVSASVQLPNTSKRLKLVFESEDQEALDEVIPTNTSEAQGTFSFLYDFIDSQKASFNIRVSLKPKLTLRYQYTHPVNSKLITRFTQSVVREEGYYATESRFDIDKTVGENNAIRWSNQFEKIQDKDGIDWISALILFQRIDNKSALSYESSINGETQPYNLTSNYRLGVRYRRNFHRKWLFYELAPEITWPRETIADKRDSVLAMVFRLEVFFDSTRHKTK